MGGIQDPRACVGEEPLALAVGKPAQVVLAEARTGGWRRGLQYWSWPFCITPQWQLASILPWPSENSPVWNSLPPSLQDAFSQPIAVLSLGLLSKPQPSTQPSSAPGDTQNSLGCTGMPCGPCTSSYFALLSTDWFLCPSTPAGVFLSQLASPLWVFFSFLFLFFSLSAGTSPPLGFLFCHCHNTKSFSLEKSFFIFF